MHKVSAKLEKAFKEINYICAKFLTERGETAIEIDDERPAERKSSSNNDIKTKAKQLK